jgi:putative transposase
VQHRRHTPEQVVRKLREADRLLSEGADIATVARHLEVSEQTFHRWRNQYGGMKADDAKRLKELEHENARLKKLLAEAELDKAMLKEVALETSRPGTPPSGGDDARGALRGLRASGVSGHRPIALHPAQTGPGSGFRRRASAGPAPGAGSGPPSLWVPPHDGDPAPGGLLREPQAHSAALS